MNSVYKALIIQNATITRNCDTTIFGKMGGGEFRKYMWNIKLMDLESVTQSEESQKEKKHHILAHICGI